MLLEDQRYLMGTTTALPQPVNSRYHLQPVNNPGAQNHGAPQMSSQLSGMQGLLVY